MTLSSAILSIYIFSHVLISTWVSTIKPELLATLVVMADQMGAWHREPAVWKEGKDNEVERGNELWAHV